MIMIILLLSVVLAIGIFKTFSGPIEKLMRFLHKIGLCDCNRYEE